tara:strand:- start:1777 stop:3030 length:1254 start_codon:yes stop_codon:yes gene_type:complete
MVIVNTDILFNQLKQHIQSKPFVLMQMYSDVQRHPQENRISCIWVDFQFEQYIVPVHHTEKFRDIHNLITTDQTIYVDNLKHYRHNSLIISDDVRDMNWSWYQQTNQPYDMEQHLTNAHHHQYRLNYDKQNINDVIPLVKHAEYFKPISKELYKSYERYDQTILENLYQIERNGLKTYEKIIYSEYNPFTSTGRPSNRFGGLNFAALNKSDGSRKQFISRFNNGVLVEMDFDAYHLRLIGEIIGYKFPEGSVHEHMGKLYGLPYEESKALSFKYLYGGITDDVSDNPFFSKVNDYIKLLWEDYKNNDFVESYIYNRKIYKKNLSDMNPNKLFNYMIQLMETENNIKILDKLSLKLQEYNSKLILYNYDAFLFDFDTKDGLDFIKMVKQTIESGGKYPVKISRGVNYHEMDDITEKFK